MTDELELNNIRDRKWTIQGCSAKTGDGLQVNKQNMKWRLVGWFVCLLICVFVYFWLYISGCLEIFSPHFLCVFLFPSLFQDAMEWIVGEINSKAGEEKEEKA